VSSLRDGFWVSNDRSSIETSNVAAAVVFLAAVTARVSPDAEPQAAATGTTATRNGRMTAEERHRRRRICTAYTSPRGDPKPGSGTVE